MKKLLLSRLSIVVFGLLSFHINAEALTCSRGGASADCLLCACYKEARGESLDGKVAVLKVVLSRVESNDFPNNVCGVLYQAGQFPWAKGRVQVNPSQPGDRNAFAQCQEAATIAKSEGANGVLYFNTGNAAWTRRLKKCGSIKTHNFYTKKGGTCPAKLGRSGSSSSSPSSNQTLERSARPAPRPAQGVN